MKLLSQIKGELEFNRNLYSLVDALGKIAVSQYYVLEKKKTLFEKAFEGIGDILGMIDTRRSGSPFVNSGNSPLGIIAVTSDSGLLGGLNAQVINLSLKEAAGRSSKLIILGEKGRLYAFENNIPCVSFKGVADETSFSQAQSLRDYVMEEVLSQKIGALKIIYPHPVSVISQRVQAITVLPLTKADRIAKTQKSPADSAGPIIESDIDDILAYIARIYLGNKFSEIFGLSRLSEMSARFTHLENSKAKIEQMNKQMRLQYFRQRHELADRNLRELFAARLAFK
jgi:ATP synthase F1 gamma subunit